MSGNLFTAQLFVRSGEGRTRGLARSAGILLGCIIVGIIGTMLGTCAAGVAYAAGLVP